MPTSCPSTSYRQPPATLAAACLLSAAGALVFNMLPVFLDAAARQFSLANEQAGWVASSFLFGSTLVATCSRLWIDRISRPLLAMWGTLLSVLGVGGGLFITSFEVLLGGLFVAGIGFGTMYTVGIAIATEHHQPSRAFGIKLAAEIFLGVAMLFILPALVLEEWGYRGVALAVSLLIGLIGGIAIRLMPRQQSNPIRNSPLGALSRRTWRPWIGLVALFIAFAAMTALWAFLQRIGPQFGLGMSTTSAILTASLIANGIAAASVGMVAGRIGRMVPLGLGMVLALGGIATMLLRHDLYGYAVGVLLTVGLWSLPLSYQMGLIAELDGSRRVAILIPAAQSFAGALGPALAGALLKNGSSTPLFMSAAGAITASLLIFLLLARTHLAPSRAA
jgi:predicted MFS family arabinose efflux permease